jgi:hypothetical protein
LSLSVCSNFISSCIKMCPGFSVLLSWHEYLLSWGLMLCVQPFAVKILSSPSLCVCYIAPLYGPRSLLGRRLSVCLSVCLSLTPLFCCQISTFPK